MFSSAPCFEIPATYLSANMRDLYKTVGKIIVLYVLIFMFVERRWEGKIF